MDDRKRPQIVDEFARLAAERIDLALRLLEDAHALFEKLSLDRAAVPEQELDGWLTRYAAFVEAEKSDDAN